MAELFGPDEDRDVSYYRMRMIALGVYVLVCSIVYFGFPDYWPKMMNVLFIPGAMLIFGINALQNEQKYLTNHQLHTPDKHFSLNIDKDIFEDEKGMWKIFRVGGINAVGISLSGSEGLIIVPNKDIMVQKDGSSWKINGNPTKIKYEKLPPEVRKKIDNENLKGPYRITVVPDNVKTHYEDQVTIMRLKQKDEDGEEEEIRVPVNEAFEDLANDIWPRMQMMDQQITRQEGYLDGDLDRVQDLHAIASDMADEGKPGLKERIIHGKEEE